MTSTTSTPKKRRKKPLASVWKPKFIEALREYGVITYAAESAGIDRTTAYKARDRSDNFKDAWDSAMEEATDSLEREARRRAAEGVDKPIVYQGVVMATYKEYSDTLLIFLLKAHRPEKFKERHDITSDDKPIQTITYITENRGNDSDGRKS